MDEQRIIYLMGRYLRREHSREELLELMEMVRGGQQEEALQAYLDEQFRTYRAQDALPEVDWEGMYGQILREGGHAPVGQAERHKQGEQKEQNERYRPDQRDAEGTGAPVIRLDEERREIRRPRRTVRVWIMRIAAAVLIGCVAGAYWLYHARVPEPRREVVALHPSIEPGGDHAVLTLSGGKQVVLDSVAEGRVAEEGASIEKKAGALVYGAGAAASDASDAAIYNTLTTPRGGKYQLTLADGTKVWLNAASSITYPTAFTEKDRKVKITGEAYLEVADNKRKPFVVEAANVVVTVLGTKFNVMAYGDEQGPQTTLIDGAVRVTTEALGVDEKTHGAVLKPGQQAALRGDSFQVRKVPTEHVIAWVKGQLSLENIDMAGLLRQVSRWYNVDVVVEGRLPANRLFGLMDRNTPISNILTVLAAHGVEAHTEGTRLIVKAK